MATQSASFNTDLLTDAMFERADPLYFDFHLVAVFERANTLRSACRNHVARL